MNEKTKKYLKNTIIVLVIIILFCSLFYLGLNGTFGFFGKLLTRPLVNSMAKLEPRVCYIYSNEWSQQDACIWASASRKSHIPLCEQINRAEKEGCLERIAYSTKDETVCALVSYELMPGCYDEVAALKKDPTVCSVLAGRMDNQGNFSRIEQCYMIVVQRNNDPNLCSKLSDPARTNCYDAIAMTGLY